MNNVLYGNKGHNQPFTMIEFINHLILVAKMCVLVYLNINIIKNYISSRPRTQCKKYKVKAVKSYMGHGQRCKNGTVVHMHVKRPFFICLF